MHSSSHNCPSEIRLWLRSLKTFVCCAVDDNDDIGNDPFLTQVIDDLSGRVTDVVVSFFKSSSTILSRRAQ